jgi:hypothetical protein
MELLPSEELASPRLIASRLPSEELASPRLIALRLPLDVIKEIFDLLDFFGQIQFRRASPYFVANCPITTLGNMEYSFKVNNDILKLYPHLTYLYVHREAKITTISHLTNLKSLCAIGDFKITENSLSNLTCLKLWDNPQTNDINHLTNLQTLVVGGSCEIDDKGTSKLTNLTSLYIFYNDKINTISHLVNLRKLSFFSKVCDNQISTLTNLTYLEMCGEHKVTNDDLLYLTNLTHLDIGFTRKITNLNHLTNLHTLFLNNLLYGIGDDGISQLTNLTELYTRGNKQINISHFTKLKKLVI